MNSYLQVIIFFTTPVVSLILIVIGSINIDYYRKNPFTSLDYDIQKNNSLSLCYIEKCISHNISCPDLNNVFESNPEHLKFFSEKACSSSLCTFSEISSCLDSLISSWSRTYYIGDRVSENGFYKYNTGIIMVVFGVCLEISVQCIMLYQDRKSQRPSRIHTEPTEVILS